MQSEHWPQQQPQQLQQHRQHLLLLRQPLGLPQQQHLVEPWSLQHQVPLSIGLLLALPQLQHLHVPRLQPLLFVRLLLEQQLPLEPPWLMLLLAPLPHPLLLLLKHPHLQSVWLLLPHPLLLWP